MCIRYWSGAKFCCCVCGWEIEGRVQAEQNMDWKNTDLKICENVKIKMYFHALLYFDSHLFEETCMHREPCTVQRADSNSKNMDKISNSRNMNKDGHSELEMSSFIHKTCFYPLCACWWCDIHTHQYSFLGETWSFHSCTNVRL